MIVIMKSSYYIIPGRPRTGVHCIFDGTRKQANKYCKELNEKAKEYTYYPKQVKVVKGE